MPTNLVQVEVDPNDPGKSLGVGMPGEVEGEDRAKGVSIPMFNPA